MTDLPRAILGRTGLSVSKLGYGTAGLRSPNGGRAVRDIDAAAAGALLNQVLDSGINFIDTSPDYGRSEERIGQYLSGRRDDVILASKCGCLVRSDGSSVFSSHHHDFSRRNIRAGVEQSLRRMKTDHLDLVQFHASPTRLTLEENDSLAELADLRDEGKIRFIGMSGTFPNIEDHIAMGVFDSFQIPYSAVERAHEEIISRAAASGAGVVIRGGVAKGIPAAPRPKLAGPLGWVAKGSPTAVKAKVRRLVPERYRGEFRRRQSRFNGANLDELLGDMSKMEFLLRFTISHPDMTTTIVGTSNPEHLKSNLAAVAKGPLPIDVYNEAKQRLIGTAPSR